MVFSNFNLFYFFCFNSKEFMWVFFQCDIQNMNYILSLTKIIIIQKRLGGFFQRDTQKFNYITIFAKVIRI